MKMRFGAGSAAFFLSSFLVGCGVAAPPNDTGSEGTSAGRGSDDGAGSSIVAEASGSVAATSDGPGSQPDAGGPSTNPGPGPGANPGPGPGANPTPPATPDPDDAPAPVSGIELWVDAHADLGGIGTFGRPFRSIRDAVDLSARIEGAVTIRVRGAVPALRYEETGSLILRAGVTLKGEARSKVVVKAKGQCDDTTCAVLVRGGARLEGITVTSDAEVVVSTDAQGIATLTDLEISGGLGVGIRARGDALIEGVHCNRNGGTGLVVEAKADVEIRPRLLDSCHFDENGGDGISVSARARLRLRTATTNDNHGSGLRLKTALDLDAQLRGDLGVIVHDIFELESMRNDEDGVSCHRSCGVRIRGCRLLQNLKAGLHVVVDIANEAAIDIGTPFDPGCNVLSLPDLNLRNLHAGLAVEGALWLNSVTGTGNSWSCQDPLVSILPILSLAAKADVAVCASAAVDVDLLGMVGLR